MDQREIDQGFALLGLATNADRCRYATNTEDSESASQWTVIESNSSNPLATPSLYLDVTLRG